MSPHNQNSSARRNPRKAQKKSAVKTVAGKHSAKQRAAGGDGRRPDSRAGAHADAAGMNGKSGKKSGKHLRRAYEHLARVRVLLRVASGDTKLHDAAERLASLVTEGLRGDRAGAKLAAELSRASEHMAFAGLVALDTATLPWSPEVTQALEQEYGKLRGDSELRGLARKRNDERGQALRTLHDMMTLAGEEALGRENYTCAMECVRAAESLASALEVDGQ
jgi:hypothetical protein